MYPLVGPLAMNPKVLKANNNYPFKTTERHRWHIALGEQEEVMGFLPVERKKTGLVINNYYIGDDNEDVLSFLFESVREEAPVTAIVLAKHAEMFARLGFETEHKWTKYIKMTYNPDKHEEQGS